MQFKVRCPCGEHMAPDEIAGYREVPEGGGTRKEYLCSSCARADDAAEVTA